MLVTRPLEQGRAFVKDYQNLWPNWLNCIVTPLLEIVPRDTDVSFDNIEGAIFSSSNAVKFAPVCRDIPAYCVGQTTTRAARHKGWEAFLVAATAKELITEMKCLRPKTPLLHIAGRHMRGKIADNLTQAGLHTRTVIVYDQALRDLSEQAQRVIGGTSPVILPVFSPRTARQLRKQRLGRAPLHLVALSPAVMDELRQIRAASKTMARAPDGPSMVAAVQNVLRRVEAGQTPQ